MIGDRRPYNVALIVLDPDGCAGVRAPSTALGDEALGGAGRGRGGRRRRSPSACDGPTSGCRGSSRSSGSASSTSEWEPGGDELTPTMKLKRRPIAEKYADEIEALYAEA